jgi:lipopolysaccharide transport system permease protein
MSNPITVPPIEVPRTILRIQRSHGWIPLNLFELWRFRDLLLTLAGRDIRLRYRQTALGVAWVVLQPLLAAGIFTFVFGKVASLSSDGIPYFLFSYAGLLAWNAFSNTITKAGLCLVTNAPLVSKVYFPRMILPLSTAVSSLLDFVVALGMLAVLMIANHWPLTPAILLMPLLLAAIMMLAIGCGLYIAALTVTYRDVQHILPVLLQFALYASPVAYSVSRVPKRYLGWYFFNPLSSLLEAFRWSILGKGQVHWSYVSYAVVLSGFILLGGCVAFKRMERKFADVI